MNDQTMKNDRKTVVIAGATGYAGRFLVQEYAARGWHVVALTRRRPTPEEEVPGVCWTVVQVTDPSSIQGCMDGAHLVVSALGITRQRDGLTYRDVDYQANMNLLQEAMRAQVTHFCYIHVLNADQMLNAPGIKAKHDFVQELVRAAEEGKIRATVVAPSGFFSDMRDFLDMASQQGRVWLFGDGSNKINPIHGKDLAKATADAVHAQRSQLNIGGPDVYSHKELAELAFSCLNKHPKISFLWDGLRRFALSILPWVTPPSISGPGVFFLTAMGIPDMTGESHGSQHLRDYYMELIKNEAKQTEGK